MKNIEAILDINEYLADMQKSLADKMFFINKIFEPFEYVVDFGCANGELIKCLYSLFSDIKFYGYDFNNEMISIAKKNVPEAKFFSEWNKINVPKEKSILNISSTIHEVYSYGTPDDIKLFWHRVFESGFKYVSIRDMCISRKDDIQVDKKDIKMLRNNTLYINELQSFEQHWGKIEKNKEFTHYLLKYSYTKNWEREVKENYLPIYMEDLLAKIPSTYEIIYMNHYLLPYKKWKIEKDFGITMSKPTHIKIILKKL